MKRMIVGLALVAAVLPWWASAQRARPHSYVLPRGFVPASVTAVRR